MAWGTYDSIPIIYGLGDVTWNPGDISGCVLWLDAAQGITMDGSNKISQWDDLSGYDNHVTQDTLAKRPTWTSAGITFDGVQEAFIVPVQFLSYISGNPLNGISTYFIYQQPSMLWGAFLMAADGAFTRLQIALSTSKGNHRFLSTVSDSDNNNNNSTFLYQTIFQANTPMLFYIGYEFDGANCDIYSDIGMTGRVLNSTGASTARFQWAPVVSSLGAEASGVNGLRGLLKEVVVFNDLLSSQDHLTLLAYFQDKYPGLL